MILQEIAQEKVQPLVANSTNTDILLTILPSFDYFKALGVIYGNTKRVGCCRTLNIYTVSGTVMPGTFGYAQLRHWCKAEDLYMSTAGILLPRGALPDAKFPAEGIQMISQR